MYELSKDDWREFWKEEKISIFINILGIIAALVFLFLSNTFVNKISAVCIFFNSSIMIGISFGILQGKKKYTGTLISPENLRLGDYHVNGKYDISFTKGATEQSIYWIGKINAPWKNYRYVQSLLINNEANDMRSMHVGRISREIIPPRKTFTKST